ncbi:MAG: ester cyclase [Planctomycetota bacterium]|nr:ester cyclase [Planctomycetota bacterium]
MDSPPADRIHAAHAALFGSKDMDAIGDFFADDYVAHVTGRDMTGGHAFLRRFLGMLHGAFFDLEVEVQILLEGEHRIAWQRTLKGTHTGAFLGFPPSGRQLVWRDMATTRFQDGLIAEDWTISDLAERLLLASKRPSA